MVSQQLKDWFYRKVNGNPDWLSLRFWPEMERVFARAERERDQAIRDGGLFEMKFAQGKLDGVHEIVNVLTGLEKAEAKPAVPGLVGRIRDGLENLTNGNQRGR